MLMRRAFRFGSFKDGFRVFTDYFTLRDYDRADKESTDRIVRKQSRGSIFAQNGWYITGPALAKQSREADGHIRNLQRALKKIKAA